jgi:hypothetical protein
MAIKFSKPLVHKLYAEAAKKHEAVPGHDERNNVGSTYYSRRAFYMGMYIAFSIIQGIAYEDDKFVLDQIKAYMGDDTAEFIRRWEVQSDK